MDKFTHQFLSLLKVSLCDDKPNPKDFENTDWNWIFKMAQKQTVIPLILDGLSVLPKEVHPGMPQKMKMMAYVQSVEKTNLKHRQVIGRINGILKENGIEVVFMKGQTTALRYPNPLHRQPGDIDFVVDKSKFDETLDILDKIGRTDRELIHEHHGMAYVEGIPIEPHYKIHNYQRPSTDRVIQKLFNEVFPSELIYTDIDGYEIPILPPTFESVFLISHMVNHIYEEGLGLRQVIDYSLFLKKNGMVIDWKRHEEYLKEMRMTKAWRIFTCLCIDYLGLKTEAAIKDFSNKEKKDAKRLFEDIMRLGNFGRGEYVFKHNGMMDALSNYLWVVKRCLKMGFVCPSEAVWWIISKPIRFINKKI